MAHYRIIKELESDFTSMVFFVQKEYFFGWKNVTGREFREDAERKFSQLTSHGKFKVIKSTRPGV